MKAAHASPSRHAGDDTVTEERVAPASDPCDEPVSHCHVHGVKAGDGVDCGVGDV